MGIKDNSKISSLQVKWVGARLPNKSIPSLNYLNVFFYKKCIIGPLTIQVGDCVLVSNADAKDPDTVEGCDVAQVIHLYELYEETEKGRYRAIVQWFSRPQCIPQREYDNDNICIDFDLEVIEEHRPYDNDISLEAIFSKCLVIDGDTADLAKDLLSVYKVKSKALPMFVCRYKFIKEKKYYRLVPLKFVNGIDEKAELPVDRTRRRRKSDVLGEKVEPKVGSARKSEDSAYFRNEKRRRASASAINSIEFIDLTELENENTVSPIKIIGGRSVVRMSGTKQKTFEKEINANYLTSPLTEKNLKVVTPTSRVSAARRNLNLSLNNNSDIAEGSDCLNYSIVKETPDENAPSNDMKIKLRLSERRKSVKLSYTEEDPLAAETEHLSRKQIVENLTPSTKNIYETPTKKSKQISDEKTPSTNRRKSILKSASTRLEGTPKRNIQLSNIVEQRIFNENDIITTPKRNSRKNDTKSQRKDIDDAEYTPKKTPRARKSLPKLKKSPTTDSTPLTPSQKLKLIRDGTITPSLDARKFKLNGEAKSELELAREHLHVSVVPQSLPCREKEFENIMSFLESKIVDECGGCMYVSGVPGTGKTATVTGVIRSLQNKVKEEDLPPFEFIEINGMRLTEPRQAYVQIFKQLTGKTLSWEHAHSLLEKRFTTPAPRRITTVLLVDELDILCNRRQDVVYNLLDWPSKSAARLVVVTIANTMDLPERLLMGKVTSRLGLTRLTFQPYTHKQLQEIVTARLGGSEAFNSDAVQLVARKVAAVSGDARRALDICRRATEIADSSNANSIKKVVSMIHVQQALNEMIASAKVQAIRNCSKYEQIFLQAVVAEVTRTGIEEITFTGVYSQIESISSFMGLPIPTSNIALRICSKLGSERLIICEHSRNDIFQKILLNVSPDDVHFALKVTNSI